MRRLTSALTLSLTFALTGATMTAADRITPPDVPVGLDVPVGFRPFLVGHAIGTQNFVCAPASTASGVDWLAIGPQATIYDDQGEQILTHFLSKNPDEADVLRPTWQHSRDTSAVWAKKVGESLDPNYVAPGAIEWLLLEVTGDEPGPTGGDELTKAKLIHRVNTVGGKKPATGCTPGTLNSLTFVDYQADYYFYRAPGGAR